VEWLPRLPVLPETGGQGADGGWLVLAGIGLLSLGVLAYRPYSKKRKS
jgi:hypothetical protein